MLRAAKGTPRENTERVLVLGVVLAFIILLSVDPVLKLMDRRSDPNVWMTASLELVRQERGPPRVRYHPIASRPVEAFWTATIQTPDNQIIATRRGGPNDYVSDAPERPPFTWEWFFDNGSWPIPAVPQKPFIVCVRYRMTLPETGVAGDSGESCSPIFDPVGETP